MSGVGVRIAGWGWVTPLGRGDAAFEALLAGETAIGPVTRYELLGARVTLAAEASAAPVDGGSHADAMAVAAARDALAMAGIDDTSDLGLWVGGTTGGMQEAEEALAALTADPTAEVDRRVIPSHVLSAPATRIEADCGPFAERMTVCSACSGGAAAIALAAAAVASGRVSRALAGGVDALCRMNHAGFNALSALDPEPCRPFHRARQGLTLGEGAAFLVLEASSEGPSLAGWALASEAHHITQPAPDGEVAAATVRRALGRAGIEPSQVGWICAHGTATPHNDPAEAAALRRAFVQVPPLSSLKGAWGHGLAAAGAMEAVASVLALSRGVPPTARLDDPDPDLADLDHVTEARGPVEAVVSDAFGFGGTDVVLAFARRAQPVPRDDVSLVVTGAAVLGPAGLSVGLDVARLALDPGAAPPDAPVDLPAGHLDPMRVRRFDRASRLATIVAQAATDGGHPEAGMVVGSAFGSVAATGAFLRRIMERGARYAPPAQFPSVLPSALASHPSIYLGLGGPALTCSDEATSGEAAVAVAQLLLEDGQAPAMVAVAAEEYSEVASRVSTPAVSGLDTTHRAEGAAAVLLETRAHASARGVTPWAALTRIARGEEAPAPALGAAVVLARRTLEGGVPEAWRGIPTYVASGLGDHESVGGAAVAVAGALVGMGHAPMVLVLGGFRTARYQWILTAPPPDPP